MAKRAFKYQLSFGEDAMFVQRRRAAGGRRAAIRVEREGRKLWTAGAAALSLLLSAACDDGGARRISPTVAVTSGGAGEASGSAGQGASPFEGEGGRYLPSPAGEPCNGSDALCDVAYDQVSFPVSHAAMAHTAPFWDYPAQRQPLRTQLDDSIRGLMLEVHRDRDELALCSHDCAEGRADLLTELRHVREFLDANPREVVTLLIDNRAPADAVASELAAAGLDAYLFAGDVAAAWPTLSALIEEGTRLVIFLQDATGAPPGYRDLEANIASTGDGFGRVRDLDCELATGAPEATMLLVQQVLVTQDGAPSMGGEGGGGGSPAGTERPSETLAALVNRDPFLSERLARCAESFGKNPTFVAVDFYDASDIIAATQRLNGIID